MERCPACRGRMISAEGGPRCMNPACQGVAAAAVQTEEKAVICRCGEEMAYRGLNSWGEPNYVCTACGASQKL